MSILGPSPPDRHTDRRVVDPNTHTLLPKPPTVCTGPECRVCTADGVCGSGQACRKALPMYRKLEGACRVGTKGFADFLGGAGRVMLSMAMPGVYTGLID